MNNENINTNMNIPSGQFVQPQVQQPVQPQRIPQPVHQPHEARLAFLIATTIVFGLISTICLLFVIRMKHRSLFAPAPQEQTAIVEVMQETPPPVDPSKIDLETEVSEMDELGLDKIIETYEDSKLEEE